MKIKVDNKKLVKVLVPIVAEMLKEVDLIDNTIHGVRWHLRHTLHLKFDRDEKEVLDSIIWWNNKFMKIYVKDNHTGVDIQDMKECYRIIRKRINELKTYDIKHNKYKEEKYEVFYKDLEEMKNLLNAIGIAHI